MFVHADTGAIHLYLDDVCRNLQCAWFYSKLIQKKQAANYLIIIINVSDILFFNLVWKHELDYYFMLGVMPSYCTLGGRFRVVGVVS